MQWGQNLGAKAIVLEPNPPVKAALEKRDKALTIRLLSPEGATSAYGYTSSLSSGGYTDVDIDPVLHRGQDYQMQAGEYTVVIGLIVDGDTTGITIPYQLVVQTVGGETGVPHVRGAGVGHGHAECVHEAVEVEHRGHAGPAAEARRHPDDEALAGSGRGAAARRWHRRVDSAGPHPAEIPRQVVTRSSDRCGIQSVRMARVFVNSGVSSYMVMLVLWISTQPGMSTIPSISRNRNCEK